MINLKTDIKYKNNVEWDFNRVNIYSLSKADTPYLVTKYIPNIKSSFNNKLITKDYKTNGVDIIISKHSDPKGHFKTRIDFDYYYHVKDNIFDINNWKKFQINWKTKETKEIELK